MPEAQHPSWDAAPVYWSTIRYYRQWLAVDGVYASLASTQLDAPVLRRIANEYRVNRLILAKKKPSEDDNSRYPNLGEDRSAGILCELLNKARSETWPTSLLCRAEACHTIMDMALREKVAAPITKGERRGEPKDLVSAITKFVWFIRPDLWTVFDRLAATGLGIKNAKARERMTAFYQALHEANADDLFRKMQCIAGRSFVPRLPAPRIIDTLLMVRAEPDNVASVVADQSSFLALLPDDIQSNLVKLARELQCAAVEINSPLTCPYKPNPVRAKSRKRKTKAHA